MAKKEELNINIILNINNISEITIRTMSTTPYQTVAYVKTKFIVCQKIWILMKSVHVINQLEPSFENARPSMQNNYDVTAFNQIVPYEKSKFIG
jgi:hypothetical protein